MEWKEGKEEREGKEEKWGKALGGFLLGLGFLLLITFLFSLNSVFSQNTLTGNVSVTEPVHVPDTYDYLEEINFTLGRVFVNVSYLYARENCSGHINEVGTKCWYLDIINSTLQELNINSTQLLKEINATTYSANLTATLTKKLVGNVLASFGKNLYVVSGDRTSVDENLTGQDGNYETIPGNKTKTFYFYLEQEPQDNLTLELITYPHATSLTANVTLNISGNSILTDWEFDTAVSQHKLVMIDKSYLSTGENSLVIDEHNNNFSYVPDFYLDYAIVYTSSAALRFLRATQYNTTNVYNYLTGTILPYLQGMNANITEILNDTDWLYNNLNCTVSLNTGNNSICTRLNYLMNWTQFLRANVTDIQVKLQSHNDTMIDLLESHNATIYNKLEGMNVTIEAINLKVGEIRNMTNCTTSGAGTVICDKLNNITGYVQSINSTITYVRTSVEEINTTTHYIWDRWKRRNSEVILGENMTQWTLSSTTNVTIWYNITIPLKQGFTSADYLPVRWKFWFLDVDNNFVCINQNRQFKNVEPYCNPLIAQYVGRPTYNYTLNISLRPSLSIGNYTVVREVEIDPDYVWITHGRGPIGVIEVTEGTWEETQGDGISKVSADTDNNYMDDEQNKWNEIFDSKLPTPTILTLVGEKNLLHGSIKVEISDVFIPDKQISWTRVFNDIIKDGGYEIPLVVNLVQGKEYLLEVTTCEGPTFDPMKYDCEIFKTRFGV